MAEQILELGGLTSRLERVERENRRLKRTWTASLLLPICLVMMGQASHRVIEAESFVLRDAAGIKRAELAMGQSDASLFFFDSKGQQSSRLSDSFLWLVNPEGRSKTEVGYVIVSTGPNGEPAIVLRDGNGFSATLGVTDLVTQGTGEQRKTSAASLKLFGKGEKVIWSAP